LSVAAGHLNVMNKKNIFKFFSIFFGFIFISICILGLFPIIDGILRWFKYRTPDNLGIAIGMVIIFFFGTPALFISIILYYKSKNFDKK